MTFSGSSKGGRVKGEGQNPEASHPSPLTPPSSPHHAIGVLGGTFDPIHFGHLHMAEELGEALDLAEVRFIPAGQPPHRAALSTPATHRLAMVRLAVADNPRFRVDAREIEQRRTSYSVDTLTDLRRELGANQALWLLLGADAFLGLPTWKDWRQLFELANIAVAHRPGYTLLNSDAPGTELRQELARRLVNAAPSPFSLPPLHNTTPFGNIALCPLTPLDISATCLRNSLQAGRSVRYLTPGCVTDYIQQHQLYLPA